LKEKITVEIDEKLNSINPRNIIIKKHGIAQPKVFAPVFPEQTVNTIH
jgi:phosphoribosylformylglycinamidine synthase